MGDVSNSLAFFFHPEHIWSLILHIMWQLTDFLLRSSAVTGHRCRTGLRGSRGHTQRPISWNLDRAHYQNVSLNLTTVAWNSTHQTEELGQKLINNSKNDYYLKTTRRRAASAVQIQVATRVLNQSRKNIFCGAWRMRKGSGKKWGSLRVERGCFGCPDTVDQKGWKKILSR